jgi:hypothetical protein
MSLRDTDEQQAKRELERLANREEYEDTPFQRIAEQWLADLNEEGDA